MRARGEVGVDKEHMRPTVGIPEIDALATGGRQRGGGRRAVQQGGRVAAAHLLRGVRSGTLMPVRRLCCASGTPSGHACEPYVFLTCIHESPLAFGLSQ